MLDFPTSPARHKHSRKVRCCAQESLASSGGVLPLRADHGARLQEDLCGAVFCDHITGRNHHGHWRVGGWLSDHVL